MRANHPDEFSKKIAMSAAHAMPSGNSCWMSVIRLVAISVSAHPLSGHIARASFSGIIPVAMDDYDCTHVSFKRDELQWLPVQHSKYASAWRLCRQLPVAEFAKQSCGTKLCVACLNTRYATNATDRHGAVLFS